MGALAGEVKGSKGTYIKGILSSFPLILGNYIIPLLFAYLVIPDYAQWTSGKDEIFFKKENSAKSLQKVTSLMFHTNWHHGLVCGRLQLLQSAILVHSIHHLQRLPEQYGQWLIMKVMISTFQESFLGPGKDILEL